MSKGYWDPEKLCTESFAVPVLEMPTLTKEEVSGLYRTFNLYIKMDKAFWPAIKKAEKLDKAGDEIFSNLAQKYLTV